MSPEEMQELKGPAYWRSLDEMASSEPFREWLGREFPEGASELDGVNRRQFLKLMAASFSLAGLGMAGCRQPRLHVLPYAKQPEEVIPGVPNYYTTAFAMPWGHVPLIVESHQGRPTKVEGNPSYLAGGGATDAYAQASVLDLYDPDRLTHSRQGRRRLGRADVFDLLDRISRNLKTRKGRGVVVLAERSSSPSRRRLLDELRESAPELILAEYEPVQSEGLTAATRGVLEKTLRVLPNYERAKRILSLDADFLFGEANAVVHARAFAKSRQVASSREADAMNRLYMAESSLSLTGAMADHRLRLASTDMFALLCAVCLRVARRGGLWPRWQSRLKEWSRSVESHDEWVDACTDDLLENQGKSLVVCGAHLAPEAHLLTGMLNEALGANGETLEYVAVPDSGQGSGIAQAADAIRQGKVQTLIVFGGNPSYDAPGDIEWFLKQPLVREVIRFGSYADESAEGAQWVVARSHYLESWDDGYTYDGYYVPVQPLIEPLYDSFSDLEFLGRLSGRAVTDPYRIVRETAALIDPSLEDAARFSAFLGEGTSRRRHYEGVDWKVDLSLERFLNAALARSPRRIAWGVDSLEVRIVQDSHAYDGRFTNNGWMMECPDPLTKLTWDNAILISPRLAKELEEKGDAAFFPKVSLLNRLGQIQRNKSLFVGGKEEAWVAEIRVGESVITGPVHVQPGLANYTVVVSMGMGRRVAGRVASGCGFDVFPLTRNGEMHVRTGAVLTLTGEQYPLANTQEHWAIEGREILREANAEEFAENPGYVAAIGMEAHSPAIYGKDAAKSIDYKASATPRGGSMYEHPTFTAPQQWAMTVDLNTCIGCNACVVACQSENNIPIVGKDQVRRGREMHWIRLDRYFSSAGNQRSEIPEEVQVSFQGVACVHCEMAPCETVCPVNATVHDEQGLNVMAYNRCVGTRYCANNCPYKVRRFNFFDWNKRAIGTFYQGPFAPVSQPETLKMQRNPDVTVRMRGVMEKCTYCVQRIESAKIRQKSLARDSGDIEVPDGTIKTACQQVCPTGAIVFGDIMDKDSAVSREKLSERDYSLLGYLNVRPRTSYLAKLRNPNPSMPDHYAKPYTRQDYEDRYGGGHADSHAHSETP